MVFGYYYNLTKRQQKIYRDSDKLHSIRLSRVTRMRPMISRLSDALAREHRADTEKVCRELIMAITTVLEVPPVRIKVLVQRPSDDREDLHGLYEPREGRKRAVISVWMRTARRRQVVAFKSFLRTVLHELCHHLDYELLGLDDSFHTEGFYKRESSLFHQLVPAQRRSKHAA